MGVSPPQGYNLSTSVKDKNSIEKKNNQSSCSVIPEDLSKLCVEGTSICMFIQQRRYSLTAGYKGKGYKIVNFVPSSISQDKLSQKNLQSIFFDNPSPLKMQSCSIINESGSNKCLKCLFSNENPIPEQ